MGVVKLLQSGLIYEDDFNGTELDPRWEQAPNDPDRISLTEMGGSVLLKHGADPLYLFFEPLTEEKEFVLDIKNLYNPMTDGDIGGLIVYARDDDYIRLDEYYDSNNGTAKSYPWLRLVRNYNTYYGYWSEDGNKWTIIGTEEFDEQSPKIGLFVDGGVGDDFNVDYVRITRGKTVKVSNLTAGTTVKLIDSLGNIVATKVCPYRMSEVTFDLPHQPFQGNFEIDLPDGSTFNAENLVLTMWAGDVYSFELSVDLYYLDQDGNEIALEEGLEEFLGYLNSDGLEYRDVQMIARNNLSTGSLVNVQISTQEYKTDQYLRMKLAEDASGAPSVYGDSLLIPTLAAGGSYHFWLRMYREDDPNKISSDVYFGIRVASTFNF